MNILTSICESVYEDWEVFIRAYQSRPVYFTVKGTVKLT